jgi:hypothetical protein
MEFYFYINLFRSSMETATDCFFLKRSASAIEIIIVGCKSCKKEIIR